LGNYSAVSVIAQPSVGILRRGKLAAALMKGTTAPGDNEKPEAATGYSLASVVSTKNSQMQEHHACGLKRQPQAMSVLISSASPLYIMTGRLKTFLPQITCEAIGHAIISRAGDFCTPG
jgi:hypothetical protein